MTETPQASVSKARKKNPLYDPTECHGGRGVQAEAIAQARAIAKLNAAGVAGDRGGLGNITANLQWEVRFPGNRIDVLDYNRNDPNAPIELIELKGKWNGGDPVAKEQLDRYVPAFPKGQNNRPVIPRVFQDGYVDSFRVRLTNCDLAGVENEVVNQYIVGPGPSDGVLLITGPLQQVYSCSDPNRPSQNRDEEQEPELVPEQNDQPQIYPAPGSDSDHDGRDDFWEKFFKDHPELKPVWPTLPAIPVPDGEKVLVTLAVLAAIAVVVGLVVLCGPAVVAAVLAAVVVGAEAGTISMGAVLAALGILTTGLVVWAVWGDPHIVTLDRLSYDLQAVGEFHLLEIPDEGVDVQARFTPTGSNISMLDRVSTEIGDQRIEIGSYFAKVDGETVDLPPGGIVQLDDGASLVRQGDTYILTWPGIQERHVMVLKGQNVGFIVPPGATTRGLVGTANGDPSDDLAMRDGTTLPAGSSAEVIHGSYADSWRIADEDSLFSYAAGQSTATFTDKAFPADIITIADFSETEIAAASAVCADAGVVPGPQFEDCVFDVARTGDNTYANAAALVTDVLVDAKAHTFNESGVLSEDFEGTVGSNFASSRYSTDASTSRVAGPLFDTPGYRMFARDIPRHDWVNVRADVLAYGPVDSDSVNQSLGVKADGQLVGTVTFDGIEPQFTGDSVGSISPLTVGQTAGGTPYSRYRLNIRIQHASSSVDVELDPSNFHGVLNTSLGLDDIVMTLETPPSENFNVALPANIPNDPGLAVAGAGALATPGSEDAYFFAQTDPTARRLIVDLDQCRAGLTYSLENTTTNARLAKLTSCADYVSDPLPQGSYVLRATGASGDYGLKLMAAPDPQTFSYTVGNRVENSQPATGAGNLETTASKDVYTFSVPQGGQTVVFDGEQSWILLGSKLIEVATGASLGGIGGHHVFDLAAGDYRIDVEQTGSAGTYWFATSLKASPQTFSYTVGNRVENGQPATGAGNLETTSSKDAYTFTVPEGGQQVVFDGEQSWILLGSKLTQVATGTNLGGIGGHHVFDLAAGDYRIDVEQPGSAGAYWFTTSLKASPQTFAYSVGNRVENGQPATGAGNLETTTSKDVYSFTVPAGGQQVVFDGEQSWILLGSKLIEVATGTSLGAISGHHVLDLAAGAYRIEVEQPGYTGTYWFTTSAKAIPQSFTYSVGARVENGQPGAGAGNLETTTSKDVYTFTVPAGGQQVVFDGEQSWILLGSKLTQVATGANLGAIGGHHVLDLAAGAYRIDVEQPGSTGSYWFATSLKASPQTFTYSVGARVENGQPGAGAGNLESTSSKDVYTFTVPAGGQQVVFDGEQSWILSGSKLIEVSTGTSLGAISGHHVLDLAAGDYRIEVEQPGSTGTYWFMSSMKASPQTFSYSVGARVENGQPAAGAGNLESTSSKDVYTFTIPAGGQQVVFDGEQSWILSGSKLIEVATGTSLGAISGHHVLDLAAGAYRIEVEQPGYTGTYWFTATGKAIPQTFSYSVGARVENGQPATGAGNLETTTSKDIYTFSVPEGGQQVVFDSDQFNTILYWGSKLTQVATGTSLGPINGHRVFDLAAGTYRIEVEVPGTTGTYWFSTSLKASPQTFSYSVGDRVENGQPAAGAGNLETTTSKDVYTFTVAEGGQQVVFDSDQFNTILYWGSKLTQVATGTSLGAINGHRVFDLAAGTYRIEVEMPGTTGTYWFSTSLKASPQTFSYSVGDRVENGQPATGAGNLETTSSKDVYTFTVPEGGQQVVFDSDQYNTLLYWGSKLTRNATGTSLGAINGHRVFDLAAGTYRVEVELPGTTGTYWFTTHIQ